MDAEIVPDTKDWTWVLDRVCPECGVDVRRLTLVEVAALTRANARSWVALLDAPVAQSRARVRPDRWSTLEYAAHVRDVYLLYARRLDLMLRLDDPLYPNWDQDETALADRYNEQDPGIVAAELLDAGDALADAFDAVTAAEAPRRGRRGDGANFTVESFARYFIHDPIHHLHDVTHPSINPPT